MSQESSQRKLLGLKPKITTPTGKTFLRKLGSFNLSSNDSYHFLRDSQDQLKVFIQRECRDEAGELKKEIWVASGNLKISHKIRIDRVCDDIFYIKCEISTIPCLLRGNKLVLIAKNQLLDFREPDAIFMLDLKDGSLTRFKEGIGEGCGEGSCRDDRLRLRSPLGLGKVGDVFKVGFWSRDFLMLDDYFYVSGEGI